VIARGEAEDEEVDLRKVGEEKRRRFVERMERKAAELSVKEMENYLFYFEGVVTWMRGLFKCMRRLKRNDTYKIGEWKKDYEWDEGGFQSRENHDEDKGTS